MAQDQYVPLREVLIATDVAALASFASLARLGVAGKALVS
jgi:hypothetical protein